MRETRTIKILTESHPKLRMIAAMTEEHILDLVERLIDNEARRLKITYRKHKGER